MAHAPSLWTDADFYALGLVPPHRRVLIPGGGPQTLAAVLDLTLSSNPEQEALVGRNIRYSYAELDQAANAAAAALLALGVRPGDRVAISAPNHPDLVVAFLGSQRIGGVWVGVNRALAAPEKAYLLRDSGASVLLVDAAGREGLTPLLDELPELRQVVELNGDGSADEWGRLMKDHQSAGRPDIALDPFAPAMISYTSGTTGYPKGAVHSQHNAVLLGAASLQRRDWDVGLRRGCGQPLTINNMMIRFGMQTFYCGGTFICMDRLDTPGLVDWVKRERIQMFSAVATMLHDLLFDPSIDQDDLSSLIRPIVGGGNLPDDLRIAFRERFGTELQFSYGLTEAPTGATQTDPSEPFIPGCSGRAMPHIDMAIRDPKGIRLPAGEEGEITLGPQSDGPWAGVYTPTLGYWRKPEATTVTVRDGWLYSGDVGMMDEEGRLFVRDRRSDLILRGGANVYPAEVERVLDGDPRIRSCAVLGVPDPRLGEAVAAVIEPVTGEPLDVADIAELQRLCEANLARYKIPAFWYVTPDMPRNAMRKIVKPQLKAMIEAGELERISSPLRSAAAARRG